MGGETVPIFVIASEAKQSNARCHSGARFGANPEHSNDGGRMGNGLA